MASFVPESLKQCGPMAAPFAVSFPSAQLMGDTRLSEAELGRSGIFVVLAC
ncbi:hypothetical protein [Bradyrhizobium japonicum]|uniref:hypothetical protein n=1 Tax=Bradyrhizobium japonicum TaxID=375 RepID=UPI001364C448|nr:hypothetical protein [Bradyrhizobium japonicum]